MSVKERKIEVLAKKFGVADGFDCKPEEKCSECLLSDNCNCLKFAKMAIEFGYENREETERNAAKTILFALKSHMYYPNTLEDPHLLYQKVVDEDDVEREINFLIKDK